MVFETEGAVHTEETLALAIQAAKERGIRELVVATTTGTTADCLERFDLTGLHVTVVTHAYGYAGPGQNTLPEEKREDYVRRGYSVCTAAHVLSGVERGLSGVSRGIYPGELIAATLRLISRGTKVCVEMGAMAADAGYITPGEPIVAVAGSGRGADTAVIMRPANSHKILDTRVDEFICKPRAALHKPE